MKTNQVSEYLGANENDQHDEKGRFAIKGAPADIQPPKIIPHKEAPDRLGEILKPPTTLDKDHVTYAERMKYEDGKMSKDEAIQMFQKLNNTGEAYRLQTHYGDTAAKLIKEGVVKDIPLPVKARNFYVNVFKEAPKNIAWELTEGAALTGGGALLGYLGSKLHGKKGGKPEATVATNEINLMKTESVQSYLAANGYNPDQARDPDGKFSAGGGTGSRDASRKSEDAAHHPHRPDPTLAGTGGKANPKAEEKLPTPKETDPNHVGVGEIMDYENGSMPQDKMVDMFQRMHNSGMAYQLQGHYGRTAHALLQGGYIK